LDIALDLSSVGTPKTDDPSNVGSVYKGNAVHNTGARCEGQNPLLPVVLPVIYPKQGLIPLQLLG
jgi:hypothetical protein